MLIEAVVIVYRLINVFNCLFFNVFDYRQQPVWGKVSSTGYKMPNAFLPPESGIAKTKNRASPIVFRSSFGISDAIDQIPTFYERRTPHENNINPSC